MKVLQILQRKGSNAVESTTPDETVAQVAKRLAEKRIGCLMVMAANGKVAGVVSERDVVRALGESEAGCLDQQVRAIMTADVVSCGPHDDAVAVLKKMTAGRFRHMPVLHDGKLLGMISIGDVVKARIDSLEHENEMLEDMIRSATG